jgi:glycosyltransferase involved in cell wall biosynthesis
MHPLAVCTIMANERPYVEEWLAFHRMQGVTLFRIYVDRTRADLPDDGTAALLRALPYDIEVVDWMEPGPRRQVAAFNAGLASLRGRAEWVAFIDADEFLFHPDMALVDWLAGIPAPAIGVQQTVFGSMGRITKPAGLVTESYTLRATRSYAEHRWFKSIVRPECAVEFHNSHMAKIPVGCVLGDGEPFTVNHPGQADRIAISGPRLHHYMLKSREEWLAKRAKGAPSDGASPGFKRFTDDYTARDAHCNLVPDDSAVRLGRDAMAVTFAWQYPYTEARGAMVQA